jgi:hypothetical protein
MTVRGSRGTGRGGGGAAAGAGCCGGDCGGGCGGGRCSARCASCVPRSASFLTATILFVIFGLIVTTIYGRSLTAVILGVVGIIVSLEAIFHIARGEWWFLRVYTAYLLAQTAVSVVVGAIALSGVGLFENCSGAQNPNACVNSQVVYGLIMALGSSSVGVFAAVNSIVVWYAMRGTPGPSGGSGGTAASGGGAKKGGGSTLSPAEREARKLAI